MDSSSCLSPKEPDQISQKEIEFSQFQEKNFIQSQDQY